MDYHELVEQMIAHLEDNHTPELQAACMAAFAEGLISTFLFIENYDLMHMSMNKVFQAITKVACDNHTELYGDTPSTTIHPTPSQVQ